MTGVSLNGIDTPLTVLYTQPGSDDASCAFLSSHISRTKESQLADYVQFDNLGIKMEQVMELLSGRKGHFLLESGHHGNLWLDLAECPLCAAAIPLESGRGRTSC